MGPKKDTKNDDEGAKMGPKMEPQNRKKTVFKNIPQHNQPQLRLPPALRGRGIAVQLKMQAKS